MPDLAHHVPLTFAEGLAAVRRAVLDPDGVPAKVVAGAVRSVSPTGASREMIDRWEVPSATGPAVGEFAALVEAAAGGCATWRVAEPIRSRYGVGGVVGAVALASVLAVETFERPVRAAVTPLGLGRERRLGTELIGLAQQLHRSFGVIPARWKALALQDRIVLRWWDTHDGAMAPGVLTGEEKWLAAAALSNVLHDPGLSELYVTFLRGQGWEAHEIEAGMSGRLPRLRKGFGPALQGVTEMLVSGLDRQRVELAGADLSAAAVEELVDIARLVRAMVVIGALA